jgi:hypothetical protein
MFTFKEPAGNKRVYDLVGSLTKRTRAIMEHFPHELAKAGLNSLHRDAPKGISGYPELLNVYQFELPGVDASAGIMARPGAHGSKVSKKDVARSVFYVRPKKVKGKYDPGATILARGNPWTADSMPYEPDRKAAFFISRMVSQREADIIRRRHLEASKDVEAELLEVGIKPVKTTRQLVGRGVTRDLAFEVLRSEFGVNAPNQAHWRPMLKEVRVVHVPRTMKRMFRWFSVPSEKRWMSPVQAQRGKPAMVKHVQKFQNVVSKGKMPAL